MDNLRTNVRITVTRKEETEFADGGAEGTRIKAVGFVLRVVGREDVPFKSHDGVIRENKWGGAPGCSSKLKLLKRSLESLTELFFWHIRLWFIPFR